MRRLAFIEILFVILCRATARDDLACVGGAEPCGGGCTLPGGHCENDQCYGPDGSWNLCLPPVGGNYASFGAPLRGSAWAWPDPFKCGAEKCKEQQFCDLSAQKCRDDTCENQFKYGCPRDKSALIKIECPDLMFNECWESRSGQFMCYLGPHASQMSCQAPDGGAAVFSNNNAGDFLFI